MLNADWKLTFSQSTHALSMLPSAHLITAGSMCYKYCSYCLVCMQGQILCWKIGTTKISLLYQLFCIFWSSIRFHLDLLLCVLSYCTAICCFDVKKRFVIIYLVDHRKHIFIRCTDSWARRASSWSGSRKVCRRMSWAWRMRWWFCRSERQLFVAMPLSVHAVFVSA